MYLNRSILPLAALILCAGCTVASAQQTGTGVDIGDLIRKLGSDDPAQRQEAEVAIKLSGGANLRTIFEAMKRPEVSLDQRKRLESAVRGPFEAAPRAGLGVRFDGQDENDAARLAGTVQGPGFHAHEFLKPGDIVRQIDNVPVDSRSTARFLIMSHDPDDIIDIVVQRQGAPVRYKIRLGSYPQLENPGAFNVSQERASVEGAFHMRLLRELGDSVARSGAAALDAGVDRTEWRDMESRLRSRVARTAEKYGGMGALAAMPRLTGAGVARQVPHHAEIQQSAMLNRQTLLSAIAQTKAMIQGQEQAVAAIKMQLEQPGIQPGQAKLLGERLEEARNEIQALGQQLDEYQRMLKFGR